MALAVTWQSNSPEQLLKERFRITTGFHSGQRDIIEQLVQGKRLLVIQRTGWGKSLCYQMASLYYPYLTIIFSPLKALMRDQYQKCNNLYNIPSAIVSSDFTEEENRGTLEKAVAGQYKLLFIAPERLSNMLWQSYVLKMKISMVVIDEAHCISTWGHDFRPHYRRIVRLLKALSEKVPVLALTATANKRVEHDILQQMGDDVKIIRGTMVRPNLYLNVVRLQGDQEKLGYLTESLVHRSGTGIIYTATQSSAEMVATFLQRQGVAAEYYHAGRGDELRQEIEQGLMANRYKVVCSTIALGMGIDKPDIRFIIHYHLPGSPIDYYQQMGRAGRDGRGSGCVLLFDPTDKEIQQHFILGAKPKGQHYHTVLSLLRNHPEGLREKEVLLSTGFSQNEVRTIFTDLEDQDLIKRDGKNARYAPLNWTSQVDFSAYDDVRASKECELADMQEYAQTSECYMGYLTAYLGDAQGYRCGVCGNCRPANFPPVKPSERIQQGVAKFLEVEFLPRIEKRGNQRLQAHEAGWTLSYHGTSRIAQLVRASKYENAGPFPEELVLRAVEVIRTRYPITEINGIVSVPPTVSGTLVSNFAERVASKVGVPYLNVVNKIRGTQEQKRFTNRLQKEENVKGAFAVTSPKVIVGQTFILIDDIYDSGKIMREVGQTLMRAGAKLVYPLAITRTVHSDDQ